MIYQKSKAKAIISSKKQITSIVNKTIEDMASIMEDIIKETRILFRSFEELTIARKG
jgi:hypothetical protein